jgi:GTP-binding protein LepA
MAQNLTVIPVINKIDLPNADLPMARRQLEDILAIPGEEAIEASAKMGIGITEILEAIIERIPPPAPPKDDQLRASVFDSVFDTYRGVVSYVRVFSGSVERGTGIRMFSTGKTYEVKEVGVFTPKQTARKKLQVGDVGYVIANRTSRSR